MPALNWMQYLLETIASRNSMQIGLVHDQSPDRGNSLRSTHAMPGSPEMQILPYGQSALTITNNLIIHEGIYLLKYFNL